MTKTNILRKGMALLLALIAAMTCLTFPARVQAAKGKINLSKAKLSVTVGANYALKLTDAKHKAIVKGVTWKSSDKKIAAVNKKGVVTGKKTGKAAITAKYKGRTYKCTVTVKQKTETLGMEAGQSVQMKLRSASRKAIPSKSATWKSSDRKIAAVNKNGVVTAKKNGKTTITAKYKGKTYKCAVTVKKGADEGKKWVVDKEEQIIYENVYKEKEICRCTACGADCTDDPGGHLEQHMLKGENGNWKSEWIRIKIGQKITRIPKQGHWEKEWTLK